MNGFHGRAIRALTSLSVHLKVRRIEMMMIMMMARAVISIILIIIISFEGLYVKV